MCIANYTLAVDRRFKRDGDPTADFIRCVAFGKAAEFVDKYCNQGTKLIIEGHIQTGNYTNKDGQKVYTTDVYVESQEFAESKRANDNNNQGGRAGADAPVADAGDGFMNVPDGIDEELPFS